MLVSERNAWEVFCAYQEYTSFIGGYTVLPLLISLLRNLFSSKNCGLTRTSLRCGSQLSCSVSSSNCSSSFCSSVSFATHASRSKAAAAPDLAGALGLGLGAPKKEVMLPSIFGFFASVPASAALRLGGMLVVAIECEGRDELRGEKVDTRGNSLTM